MPNDTTTTDAEPAQWSHIPGLVERDRVEGDTEDHHNHDATGEPGSRACFGCWCYACGGRTDRPRDRKGDDRTGLADPDSHRWCYE